jgi:hypothetical protein
VKELIMSALDFGADRGRRSKAVLSAARKYQIWLQLVPQIRTYGGEVAIARQANLCIC